MIIVIRELRLTILYLSVEGGEICSGKGECECGKCKCIVEDGARYSGQYCEECPVRFQNFLSPMY